MLYYEAPFNTKSPRILHRLQIWKTYSAHVTESRVRKKEVRGYFGKTDITAHTLLSLLSPPALTQGALMASGSLHHSLGNWIRMNIAGRNRRPNQISGAGHKNTQLQLQKNTFADRESEGDT